MIQFFNRFFLNKTVFIVWTAGLGFLFPLSVLMCVMSGQMTVFSGLIYFVSLMLIINIIIAYRRHDMILMNGLITAIMITEILRYAFVISAYLQMDTQDILTMGFVYCLEVSLHTFALLIEALIAYNHYTLNTKHGNNQTKIVVNQFTLGVLGFVFLGIVAINWFANTDPWVLLSNSLIYLCDILLYGAVSCCEATLAVERIDNTMTRGNPNDIKGALWYLIMFLFGLFGLVLTYLLKNLPSFLVYGDLFITIICGAELIYYLHRKKKNVKKAFLLGQTLVFLMSLGTLCFMVSFFLLGYSEFHTKLEADAKGKLSDINMTEVEQAKGAYIYQTDELYFIFPEYNEIDYVFGDRPSKSDASITFLGAAAPTWDYEFSFNHENIAGDHVKDGQYYKGHKLKQYYPDPLPYGTFTFFDGKGHIVTTGEPEDQLKKAAQKGGDGFIVEDLLFQSEPVLFKIKELRSIRAMTEIQGRICIVDTINLMEIDEFEALLQKEGIKDALYLGGGAGWNYSWYRDKNDQAVNLYGIPVPFSNNWIVFKK